MVSPTMSLRARRPVAPRTLYRVTDLQQGRHAMNSSPSETPIGREAGSRRRGCDRSHKRGGRNRALLLRLDETEYATLGRGSSAVRAHTHRIHRRSRPCLRGRIHAAGAGFGPCRPAGAGPAATPATPSHRRSARDPGGRRQTPGSAPARDPRALRRGGAHRRIRRAVDTEPPGPQLASLGRRRLKPRRPPGVPADPVRALDPALACGIVIRA